MAHEINMPNHFSLWHSDHKTFHQLDMHVISLSLDNNIAKTENIKFDPNVVEPINSKKNYKALNSSQPNY